jgi:hypothetical protein
VAHGRDDGRYADSPLKPWFDNLHSSKGLCCSFADGVTLKDPDWDQNNNHYRVRIPAHSVTARDKKTFPEEDTWVEVPDDAVIKEPNKFGPAVVWPFWSFENNKLEIRCFIPGSLT